MDPCRHWFDSQNIGRSMAAIERIEQVVVEADSDDERWKRCGCEPREQSIVFIAGGVDGRCL
jgi:hypothetical protein